MPLTRRINDIQVGRRTSRLRGAMMAMTGAAVGAAAAFLADPAVTPALRRLVLEGRAGVERSLRARAFDAS